MLAVLIDAGEVGASRAVSVVGSAHALSAGSTSVHALVEAGARISLLTEILHHGAAQASKGSLDGGQVDGCARVGDVFLDLECDTVNGRSRSIGVLRSRRGRSHGHGRGGHSGVLSSLGSDRSRGRAQGGGRRAQDGGRRAQDDRG